MRILGRRLKGLLWEDQGEFVARIGGDEFSAIHRLDEGSYVSEFLTRLEKALFTPLRIDDCEVVPGASFGIAIYRDDGNTKPGLINNADLAMYQAKVDPLKKICFYEPSMDEAVRARRSLAVDLGNALKSNQLSLHYQVQTALSTNEIRGYEALLRWHHPQHGFVSPSEFIPIAEENGRIPHLGEWVLRQACMTATIGELFYKVAVNLSAIQFAHSDLPRLIIAILVETGLSPERLEIELTESTIFADRERALHTLRQIKDLGVSVALDDFGTGHSSPTHLRCWRYCRSRQTAGRDHGGRGRRNGPDARDAVAVAELNKRQPRSPPPETGRAQLNEQR